MQILPINVKCRITKFVYLFIGLLVVLVVFPKKAMAAELSLGVYPPVLQIIADPPASVKAPISVKNLSDEPVSLDIFFKPFTGSESEDGQLRYLKTEESFGENPLIFHFMQIMDNDHAVKSLNLAPGQQKDLTFHIGILKDELPSDYYFSILFVQSPERAEPFGSEPQGRRRVEGSNTETNLTQITGGIAINTLLSVSPDKARGAVEEFSVPFFLEKGPVPFTIRVKNTGKNYISPTGTILIKNMFGQTVGKVELLPVNILAGTTRAIPDLLQSPDATPSATSNFSPLTSNSPKAYWHESLLFGPYTATLTIALSDKGPVFQKTTRFVGFPVQVFVGLILVLIIILIIKNRLGAYNRT